MPKSRGVLRLVHVPVRICRVRDKEGLVRIAHGLGGCPGDGYQRKEW